MERVDGILLSQDELILLVCGALRITLGGRDLRGSGMVLVGGAIPSIDRCGHTTNIKYTQHGPEDSRMYHVFIDNTEEDSRSPL